MSTLIRSTFVVASLAVCAPSNAFAASAAPLGFQLMCLQSPKQCVGGGSAKVGLTENVLATIQRVNSQVNRAITPRNEAGDTWNVGVSAGDCEDYVLTKRQELIRAGLPASSLRMAHVKTRQGVDHAVLIVKTDSADLVLDNLEQDVGLLQNTSYRILATSGADPMAWSR